MKITLITENVSPGGVKQMTCNVVILSDMPYNTATVPMDFLQVACFSFSLRCRSNNWKRKTRQTCNFDWKCLNLNLDPLKSNWSSRNKPVYVQSHRKRYKFQYIEKYYYQSNHTFFICKVVLFVKYVFVAKL